MPNCVGQWRDMDRCGREHTLATSRLGPPILTQELGIGGSEVRCGVAQAQVELQLDGLMRSKIIVEIVRAKVGDHCISIRSHSAPPRTAPSCSILVFTSHFNTPSRYPSTALRSHSQKHILGKRSMYTFTSSPLFVGLRRLSIADQLSASQ